MLSLRVSRDKRGYDYIYLLLEARRRGRVENRLLYCGRWPTPCRVGTRPFDDETRARLEEAHPDVAFDWPTLLKTLQAALGVSRPAASGPPPPPQQQRSRRPGPDRDRPGMGGAPPAYGGRPGQARRPDGPSAPRPSEPEPEPQPELESEPESDYAPAEVVLVSADLEERDSSYVAPEFEAVHEVEQSFAASFEVELASEGTVEIPIPEATEPPTVSVEGHTFAPPAEEDRAVDIGSESDDDSEDSDEGDAEDEGEEAGGSAEVAPSGPGAPGATPADPNRPRRRRRRRGGRGRGKPPESRQGSE